MGSESRLSTRVLIALACTGAIAAAAAADLMLPTSVYEVSLDDGVDFWAVVFLAIPALMIQGMLVAFMAEIKWTRPDWQTAAVIVLALPLLLVGGWLFHTRAVHAEGREVLQLYDRYFQRIPDSKRDDAFIAEEWDDHYIICSELGRKNAENYLCIEADIYRKYGQQVVAGFKSRYIETVGGEGAPAYVAYDAYDCWGDSYACD